MKKIVFIFILLLVSGCGIYEDFQVLLEENDEYRDSLDEKLGFRPSVSTNITNGYFTVSATVKVGSVGDMTVKEIYDVLRTEAEGVFTKPVNSLVISITD